MLSFLNVFFNAQLQRTEGGKYKSNVDAHPQPEVAKFTDVAHSGMRPSKVPRAHVAFSLHDEICNVRISPRVVLARAHIDQSFRAMQMRAEDEASVEDEIHESSMVNKLGASSVRCQAAFHTRSFLVCCMSQPEEEICKTGSKGYRNQIQPVSREHRLAAGDGISATIVSATGIIRQWLVWTLSHALGTF